MPGLRKVSQVIFSNDRDETTVSFLLRFPFFLFLFFLCNRRRKTRKRSLTRFVFFSVFLFVTEGENQGNDVDSICGVIKREMVAALGFEWWKNTMQPATNDAKAHKFNNADY